MTSLSLRSASLISTSQFLLSFCSLNVSRVQGLSSSLFLSWASSYQQSAPLRFPASSWQASPSSASPAQSSPWTSRRTLLADAALGALGKYRFCIYTPSLTGTKLNVSVCGRELERGAIRGSTLTQPEISRCRINPPALTRLPPLNHTSSLPRPILFSFSVIFLKHS